MNGGPWEEEQGESRGKAHEEREENPGSQVHMVIADIVLPPLLGIAV